MRIRPSLARSARGFTLYELMITIALAAVIATVAVPNMRVFILNNRLTTTTNDLLHAFQHARSEAVKRGRFVVVCASANPTADEPTCSEGNFAGWIVFEDTDQSFERDGDEKVLLADTAESGVTVLNDATGILSYGSSGFANAVPDEDLTSVVVICDERGTQRSGDLATSRAISVADTGRVRATRSYTEVVTAIGRLPAAGVCAATDGDDGEGV